MVRAARRVSSEEAAQSHEAAHCLWTWEEDGSLYVTARLPAEDGAALIKALERSRDELNQRRFEAARESGELNDSEGEAPQTAFPGSAEPHAPAPAPAYRLPTNAECLAHVATSGLARGPTDFSAASNYQVIVHIDAERLARAEGEASSEAEDPDADPGACHLDGGPAISAETARRIGCDSDLLTLAHGEAGEVLSAARRRRTVSPALRRVLEARDGGCRFPGCERRRFVEAHHIRHWADGGETSLANVASLCRYHHRLCHEHGFAVTGDANERLTFRNRRGDPIPEAPPLGPASPEALPRPTGAILTGTGEPMNLGYCVDAVGEGSRYPSDTRSLRAPEGSLQGREP